MHISRTRAHTVVSIFVISCGQILDPSTARQDLAIWTDIRKPFCTCVLLSGEKKKKYLPFVLHDFLSKSRTQISILDPKVSSFGLLLFVVAD